MNIPTVKDSVALPKLKELLIAKRADLLALQADVTEALRQTEADARKKAKADALSLIEAAGFTADELFGDKAPKPRVERQVRYRNDKGNEWTGRGKRPEWVNEFVASGGDLEAIKIT